MISVVRRSMLTKLQGIGTGMPSPEQDHRAQQGRAGFMKVHPMSPVATIVHPGNLMRKQSGGGAASTTPCTMNKLMTLSLALLFTACAKDDGPASPSGGGTSTPPAIPTSFTVDEIAIHGFQWYRLGVTPLESWDDDNILTTGVADIFVAYHSTTPPEFRSEAISNADLGHPVNHLMNDADWGMLSPIPFRSTWTTAKVQLWDEDGWPIADDRSAPMHFLTGSDLYENDEARPGVHGGTSRRAKTPAPCTSAGGSLLVRPSNHGTGAWSVDFGERQPSRRRRVLVSERQSWQDPQGTKSLPYVVS